MTNIKYAFMEDLTHAETVLGMMNRLYAEDGSLAHIDTTHFPQTLDKLLAHPHAGRIVLLQVDGEVRGYALLIPYWSNEFGGFLVFVDELYVIEASRGRGLGSGFFRWLVHERPFDAVAIFLEVTPDNQRARRLYQRLGFTERTFRTLLLRLK
jgi:ribosomal protein S18 acetylase RimI-like enzyme